MIEDIFKLLMFRYKRVEYVNKRWDDELILILMLKLILNMLYILSCLYLLMNILYKIKFV